MCLDRYLFSMLRDVIRRRARRLNVCSCTQIHCNVLGHVLINIGAESHSNRRTKTESNRDQIDLSE